MPFRLFAFLLMGLSSAAIAQSQEPPRPLWELGVVGAGVSQAAYPGADEQVARALVLPFFIYRGKFLRADRGSIGVRAVKTSRSELDIGFSGSIGASSNEVEARRGMPSLGTLVEFGPRLRVRLGELDPSARSYWELELPLRAVLDASDSLRHRGAAAEPELNWRVRADGGLDFAASVGLVFGDRKLNDYLYGVAPAYATATRPAYTARSGLIATRLGLSASKRLHPDWRVFAYARYDSVRGAANEDSPLVRKSGGATAGVALAWTFWRSQRSEQD